MKLGVLTLLSLLVFTGACKKEAVNNEQAVQNSGSQKRKACLSFQGNGVYYAAHVGALIALLENNYEPVFATGGSSGAIIASLARALVENPSLRGSDATFDPQKAALLLASSSPVIESFLFLPRFTTPFKMTDSLDVFFSGSAVGVINATPKDAMVHAESVVGQSTLVVDFYRSIDFKSVLSGKTLVEREQAVSRLWRDFAGAIRVTPDDFADAILTPRSRLSEEGRTHLVLIQDRFFKMYMSKQDTMVSNFRTAQEDWNKLLAGIYQIFGLNKPEKRRAILKNFLNTVRTIESFDSLAATLSGEFMLADPDRVYRAYGGFDFRTGRLIEIPSNVILHTTARRATKINKEWKEHTGLQSLYQVYMSNSKDASRNASILLKPENNPLQPSDRTNVPTIPSERLVTTAIGLGPALMASTGEVSAFVRMPVAVDSATRQRFSWYSDQEQLMGFGGWLEKVSLGTAMKFNECSGQNVDLYFYTSDGDSVTSFSKMVFTGLFLDVPMRGLLAKQLENPTADLGALLSGKTTAAQQFEPPPEQKKAFEQVLTSMENLFIETRASRARLGNLPVNFSFAEPSKMGGKSSKELDIVYRSNRRALILAVYEYTRKLALERGLGSGSLPLWNARLDTVLGKRTPTEILSVVSEIMPRLTLAE